MNTSKVKITAGLLILMLAGQTAGSRWFYFPTPLVLYRTGFGTDLREKVG
ncbi:MAG: hypothetical protein ABIK22_03640 [candidate division WOR-3 bacterium]